MVVCKWHSEFTSTTLVAVKNQCGHERRPVEHDQYLAAHLTGDNVRTYGTVGALGEQLVSAA